MGAALARRLLLVLAGCLCLPAWAADAACAPPSVMPPVAELAQLQAAARDRGFLWRLRAGGHDSWLYGTVHVGRVEWMFPGPHMRAALQASDVVALEMDPLDPSIGQRMQQLAARHAGRWPAALVPRLQAQMAKACVPATLQQKMHPVMLLSTVGAFSLRSQQLQVEYAPEFVLAGFAHARGVPVVSMETPEAQARALLGTKPPGAAELAGGLEDLESGHAASLVAELVANWADSDWDHLQDYAAWCGCLRTADDRQAMKRLLDDRNPGLARTIDQLHRGGKRVFAATGALHMVGPKGLLALLRQQGYAVELQPPGL